LQWARNEMQYAGNEYLTNLFITCKHTHIKDRDCGLVASLIPAFQRATHQEIERSQAQQSSNFIGSVKDKVQVQVTLSAKKAIETFYGTSHLHTMVDASGNQFVWFSSNDTNVNVGDTFTVTGTVKEHKEYNGVKQTVLTRCKVK